MGRNSWVVAANAENVGRGGLPRGPRPLGAIGSRASNRTTLPHLRWVTRYLAAPSGGARLLARHVRAQPGAGVTAPVIAHDRFHRTSPVRLLPARQQAGLRLASMRSPTFMLWSASFEPWNSWTLPSASWTVTFPAAASTFMTRPSTFFGALALAFSWAAQRSGGVWPTATPPPRRETATKLADSVRSIFIRLSPYLWVKS